MESNDDLMTSNEITVNEVPLSSSAEALAIGSDNGLELDRKDSDSTPRTDESMDCQKSSSCDETSECEPIADKADLQTEDAVKADRYQYSKEQLIAISKLSLARIRPKRLDNAFNNPENGLWDPEKWMSSKGLPTSASNNRYKRDGNENYTKKDAKDRVIEEQNDIILSPQRGSFGTGCHVSATTLAASKSAIESRSRDHFSDRNKSDDTSDGTHRQNITHRRVGTGRIIPKDRDRPNEWVDRSFDRDRNFDHRSEGRTDVRDNRDNRDNRDMRSNDFNDRRNNRRFERRPNMNPNRNNRFGRDGEQDRYDNRYSNRYEEDEPEWFTEGPTSKHETIELKGFDDDSERHKERKESVDSKSSEDKNSDIDNQKKSFPKEDIERKAKDSRNESKSSEDFDVNEYIKSDDWFGNGLNSPDHNKLISSMDGISENADNECDNNGKSRFNRWFKGTPTPGQGSQMNASNAPPNEALIRASNGPQRETRASTLPPKPQPTVTSMPNIFSSEPNERNIFDLLKNTNRMSLDQMSHNKLDLTKVKNVSEIEASLMQLEANDGDDRNEKKAFDRLIQGLGKKSVSFRENTSPLGKSNAFNDLRSETTILQSNHSNIVIPKTQHQMLNAPTILELLKEEEKREAMADSQRNAIRLMQNQRNANNAMIVSNPSIGPHMPNHIPEYYRMQSPAQPQEWHMKNVRPRNPTVQEMNDNTNYILQNALLKRQHMEPVVKSPQLGDSMRANTPSKGMTHLFTPTSVIRKMHSNANEKDKELVNRAFDEMTPEPLSSQQKFINEQLLLKPMMAKNSPLRAIIKSNNPMGQAMAHQSPLSPQSEPTPDPSLNSLIGLQSPQHFILQHQLQQQSLQNSSQMPPQKLHQRPLNPPNSNARSFGVPLNPAQGSMGGMSARSSTPSPNANNNMQLNSIPNMLQLLNQSSTARPNQPSVPMNPMMAFQQLQPMPQHSAQTSVPNGQRLPQQYSQSRPLSAAQLQQLFNKGLNSDQLKNFKSESDHMKTSFGSTYPQSRPHMNSGYPTASPGTDARLFGQFFGNETLNQPMPDMPPVPLQNVLTLEDIERS